MSVSDTYHLDVPFLFVISDEKCSVLQVRCCVELTRLVLVLGGTAVAPVADGSLLGKLLKRRAVSDGRLRRGLRVRKNVICEKIISVSPLF